MQRGQENPPLPLNEAELSEYRAELFSYSVLVACTTSIEWHDAAPAVLRDWWTTAQQNPAEGWYAWLDLPSAVSNWMLDAWLDAFKAANAPGKALGRISQMMKSAAESSAESSSQS